MTKITKIKTILISTITIIILAYLLIPYKKWKEYKESHPSLFITKDSNTPHYWDFIKSYWKTNGKIAIDNTDDLTYDGGELSEIIITP